jgi:hypothetical protein
MLDELGGHLAGHLRRGVLPRSALEEALGAIGAGEAGRADAVRALENAGIALVEDAPILANSVQDEPRRVDPHRLGVNPTRPARRASRPTDPLEAGRRRLTLDRYMNPSRLPRVLLTAEEEVGLTLLARPDGQALEPGEFRTLEGDARDAAEALVMHNLRLAHSMARAYAGQGLGTTISTRARSVV